MGSRDAHAIFQDWFTRDTDGDAEFSGVSAKEVIEWAGRQRDIRTANYGRRSFLGEMLSLPSSGMSFREFFYRNYVANPHPFRTTRRVGGDHDRGFSFALNKEMAYRARDSQTATKPNAVPEKRGVRPLRPPLKRST
jgi:hypothetical protein